MDPTLSYCKIDEESSYTGSRKWMTARGNLDTSSNSANIFTDWIIDPRDGNNSSVWRDTEDSDSHKQQEKAHDYNNASSDIDPDSLAITPYGDEAPLNRYEWLDQYDESLKNFFGPSVDLFYDSKSLLFANIDAVLGFIPRTGGLIAANEYNTLDACFTGSLALAGMGYCLYRVPVADALYLTEKRIAPSWVLPRCHYVLDTYGERFLAEPQEQPVISSPYVIPSVISERFPGKVGLIVGDYDFPLRDIDRVLLPEGNLLLFLPGDVDAGSELVMSSYMDVLHEISVRFNKVSIFSPLALLGRGLVIVATGVHSPYVNRSEKADSVKKSMESFVKRISIAIDAQFALPWTDIESYNHERATVAWDVF